jgi:hypothetical protein
VFHLDLLGSEQSMRALIDGGLARLIATRIAATVLEANNQADDHTSRCAADHVTDRTKKL